MEMGESLKKLFGLVEEGAKAGAEMFGSATKPVDVSAVAGEAVGDKLLDLTGSPAVATAGDVTTQLVADPTNLLPQLKAPAFVAAGLIKGQEIFRGLKKGTEEMSFLFPREAGTHVTIHKETAEKFAKGYGKEGEVVSWTSNVEKPFNLEEVTPTVWWPHNTADNILKGGKSPLSDKAKSQINQIKENWLLAREKLDGDRGLPWDKYGEAKDELSSIYNKRIIDVLKKEGYDHISYPNLSREVAEGGKGAESAIIFDKRDVSKVPVKAAAVAAAGIAAGEVYASDGASYRSKAQMLQEGVHPSQDKPTKVKETPVDYKTGESDSQKYERKTTQKADKTHPLYKIYKDRGMSEKEIIKKIKEMQ